MSLQNEFVPCRQHIGFSSFWDVAKVNLHTSNLLQIGTSSLWTLSLSYCVPDVRSTGHTIPHSPILLILLPYRQTQKIHQIVQSDWDKCAMTFLREKNLQNITMSVV